MSEPIQECPLVVNWTNRGKNETPRIILGYSIDTQYLTSTDEFSITVYDPDPARVRGLLLEPVELAIHGAPVLVGRVEHIERGRTGSAITLTGRDYISEFTESSIDPEVKVEATQTLQEVVKLVLAPWGISTVIYSAAGDSQVGDQKPEPGMGAYDFLNRIAARLGATIQPARTRNAIELHAPDYTADPAAELFRSSNPTSQRRNNIDEASSTEDASRMPTVALASGKIAKAGEGAKTASTEYDVAGKLQAAAPALFAALDGKVASGRRKPSAGRAAPGPELYRLLYHKDDKARTEEQVAKGISRAVADRLKDTLTWTCRLKGHRMPDGKLWQVGNIHSVSDSVCDIEERLWCSGRRYEYSREQGSSTQLTHWRLGAFIPGGD